MKKNLYSNIDELNKHIKVLSDYKTDKMPNTEETDKVAIVAVSFMKECSDNLGKLAQKLYDLPPAAGDKKEQRIRAKILTSLKVEALIYVSNILMNEVLK